MINAQEEYRRGYEAGYMYGRIDELQGREYDDRTPAERNINETEAKDDQKL